MPHTAAVIYTHTQRGEVDSEDERPTQMVASNLLRREVRGCWFEVGINHHLFSALTHSLLHLLLVPLQVVQQSSHHRQVLLERQETE